MILGIAAAVGAVARGDLLHVPGAAWRVPFGLFPIATILVLVL